MPGKDEVDSEGFGVCHKPDIAGGLFHGRNAVGFVPLFQRRYL